jgi:ubiquinone/menaquinone biosynthesis C-methylase UbiE
MEDQYRKEFTDGNVYTTSKICRDIDRESSLWIDVLQAAKIDSVISNYRGGTVVDLCCATGNNIFEFAPFIERGIGVDFSPRYLDVARESAWERGYNHLDFICADARALPLASGSVDLLYCLSSLYVIPGAPLAMAEIGRVLSPGGRCVLDLGLRPSLNGFCCQKLTGMVSQYLLTFNEVSHHCAANNLVVRERRCFQLLPLWTDEPRWLWPLVHPNWRRWLAHKVKEKMLDEWISSMPWLRRFAFRHLLVCQKKA